VAIQGGIGASPLEDGRPFAAFAVEANDPEATLKRVVELGGNALTPFETVRGLDMAKAYVSDPEGMSSDHARPGIRWGEKPSDAKGHRTGPRLTRRRRQRH